MRPLVIVVEEHLAEWETPYVEHDVFGTDVPEAIAAAIDEFCRRELGAPVVGCHFYGSSTGAVGGLVLADGRAVVLKVHRGRVPVRKLRAVQSVMATLSQAGFPCPAPCLAPTTLAHGTATVEAYVTQGETRDAHCLEVREEIASRLAELVTIASRGDIDRASLGGAWFGSLPSDKLWPRPHSQLFDFEATASGAEWIDAWARRARGIGGAGDRVVGHFDWRAEHFRFVDDRIVVAYDWDSLHFESEAVMVGAAAHAFTANWEDEGVFPAPSVEEIQAFIAAYQQARGRPFGREEQQAVHASTVYSIAYTARCQHALEPEPKSPRSAAFRDLLGTAGNALLGS
ncbi:MAG: phosphotransferase [Myxococcota bacterium]